MTATEHRGPIAAALEQQREFFPGLGISLDSLWRAAGRPAGLGPRDWAEGPAAPLVAGFAAYRGRLAGGRVPALVLWSCDETEGDPWRYGDLMADEPLARIYAEFLEGGRDR